MSRIPGTIRRSRRRRRLTVGTIRLRESKPTRVTAARYHGTTCPRDTPDLREFQRYLSKEGSVFVIARPFERLRGLTSLARNVPTISDGHDAATSGFRGIRAIPENGAAPPFSFTHVTLRDSLRPVSPRPVPLDKRDGSGAATPAVLSYVSRRNYL